MIVFPCDELFDCRNGLLLPNHHGNNQSRVNDRAKNRDGEQVLRENLIRKNKARIGVNRFVCVTHSLFNGSECDEIKA